MAFNCMRTLSIIRILNTIHRNTKSTAIGIAQETKIVKPIQFKTEDKIVYLEDPDIFGTLSKNVKNQEDVVEDDGDIKEQQYLSNLPLHSQKLTIKQYADLIKQYVLHKRLKEAFDILEVRMLTVDRVKPENYIYNILIGACADVGYTKKAFKLFNDMKKRALKPTGDTYTCLFNACANSPWAEDGLKNAHNLRALMTEKAIEPNLTNYNAMIKAFGRCGDLPTAFKIVDEMTSKKIKIRVHTFNHLLHACISDKNNGLRHALVVWRKMLTMREKPNIFSFNLMLKCVKECNLGSKADIEELIVNLQANAVISDCRPINYQITSTEVESSSNVSKFAKYIETSPKETVTKDFVTGGSQNLTDNNVKNELEVTSDNKITLVNKVSPTKISIVPIRLVPNLLSRVIQMQQVLALQEIDTLQDKFAVIGGQEDFLKEMEVYSVKPDIKIFTQMITLLDDTHEAENKLLETMKKLNINADIDFYNILIKKRCLRGDYDGAFAVKNIIRTEAEIRKKRFSFNKKLRLKFNIMTYGVLAMACQTKESAVHLLNEMNDSQLKTNIEIFGTLLKNGAMQYNFEYIMYIMNRVKEENTKINEAFLKHLEKFIKICRIKIRDGDHSETFATDYKNFSNFYKYWIDKVNVSGVLSSEHPWQQFKESYPESVQRSNVVIKEPKRFYKRNKKFVKYTPRM
ncbi:unnamed protein product [Diatraea saccharalis]|uniref:Pentatricopeptide repeat-containing protein n=1 Tax=Diatraea saccharalis TaxID=40085 RepID=A0A9N9WJU7_9NEOP|nr:unnamed protein product [Diatraea saccharalis]